MAFCTECGTKMNHEAIACPQCGKQNIVADIYRKIKGRAVLYAAFLGAFGVHKFYLGKPLEGILYLALCWTSISFWLGIVDAIILLTMSEVEFNHRYNNKSQKHPSV